PPTDDINTYNLQHLLVPARAVLKRMFSASRQAWLDGARSVTLAYFAEDPLRDDGLRYPLSLVGFWLEIFNFVNQVVDPWNRSVNWLHQQRALPGHIRSTVEDLHQQKGSM
ncbi:hypothetical protein FRC01_011715, partial [Tulasnella sp. 417]